MFFSYQNYNYLGGFSCKRGPSVATPIEINHSHPNHTPAIKVGETACCISEVLAACRQLYRAVGSNGINCPSSPARCQSSLHSCPTMGPVESEQDSSLGTIALLGLMKVHIAALKGLLALSTGISKTLSNS